MKVSNFALLFIPLFILNSYASAQSLLDHVGGIKTEFILTSDSVEIVPETQAIVKKSFYRYDDNSDGYSYGLGTEACYLEIMIDADKNPSLSKDFLNSKDRYKFNNYDLILFNLDGQSLGNVKLDQEHVAITTNGAGLKTYSINLHKVPFLLLDLAHQLELH